VSATDPTFSTRDGPRGLSRLRRYWRGPTWINAAWLLWRGLVRLGYSEQAADLTDRLSSAIQAAGLREYYHPYTGRGMGAVDFAWSSLILEMIEPDPAPEIPRELTLR
jgi:glycogen debranching enzyme